MNAFRLDAQAGVEVTSRLRSAVGESIFAAVLGHQLVVVSDAHLGVAPPVVEAALLAFLEAVPTLGDCLLVNGDLFDFWFSYSRVIPRRGFHVAAALARVRRRIPVLMVGGNHDRWGGDFWERDIGLRFHPYRLTFDIGDRRAAAVHGDGLTEPHRRARLLHRVINHPATAAIYRWLHPELGLRLVDLLSPRLGDHTEDDARLDTASRRQRSWAERLLQTEPEVGLVIMGHTHRAQLSGVGAGGQYLNPGAWFDRYRYAVATESGAELRTFEAGG
ncbi:MAG: metallophosphoesterase family protein [Gemmatimonadales bacterium]|nr:metallophosphoesterase family protein [Gemmatimonadales bacterium]